MLKVLPSANLSQTAKVKCGEIFLHSFTDYTIYCTFCDMKSFKFEDFLLHVQNIHFENNLMKPETISTDCTQFLEVSVKNEDTTQVEKTGLWDDLEQPYDIGDYDINDDSSNEEEPVTILKKKVTPKKRKKSKPKSVSESDYEDNDHRSDEDLKPMINEHKTAGVNVKKLSKKTDIPTPRVRSGDPKFRSKKKEKEIIEHTCPECAEIFTHLKFLDRHVFEYHDGYKCSMCDKRLRRRPDLVRHLKNCAAEKKFTCPVEECGRGFTDQEYLKRHLEVHTMECTFICDFENCGKAFQTQRRLTIHTYTHRKPKKLVCDVCGYSCRSNITFKIHQRVHTGERPFGCEVCEKHFVSKAALTEHMLSHSTIRPHVCEICSATFANPRVLVRHRYIHSDEKTFKCKLCDSAFKHPNSLDGHMRRIHRPPKLKQSEVTVTSSLYTFN